MTILDYEQTSWFLGRSNGATAPCDIAQTETNRRRAPPSRSERVLPVGKARELTSKLGTQTLVEGNPLTDQLAVTRGEAVMAQSLNAEDLRPGFRGELLCAGDQGYDAARKVFNAMIDKRPDLIAKCACAEDVRSALKFARAHEAPLAVRGGGHNVAGFAVCDQGVVIDLSRMKRIVVDPAARTVYVEAGATWGDVSDALQSHGLAATGGYVSTTGVSGLTLGGGFGWLVRKHGLAIDNLLAAEVVLADGRTLATSESENEDLFWAIRGGGGNFGIVTSFTFRVHPAGTVLAGLVVHPVTAAESVLRRWRTFEETAPEELTQGALLFHFGDDPALPAALQGAPVIALGGVYAAADLDEGERVLAPLRAYGPPVADLFQRTPYNLAQRMGDFLWPPGLYNYWKSAFRADLSDQAIGVIRDFYARVPSKATVVVLESLANSAIQRVPEEATAFVNRRFPFNFLVTSAWSDPVESERNVAWTRQFFEAMRPFTAGAAYVNYIGDEGADGLRVVYGADSLARLERLKVKYDPTNTFRLNQNVARASRRS